MVVCYFILFSSACARDCKECAMVLFSAEKKSDKGPTTLSISRRRHCPCSYSVPCAVQKRMMHTLHAYFIAVMCTRQERMIHTPPHTSMLSCVRDNKRICTLNICYSVSMTVRSIHISHLIIKYNHSIRISLLQCLQENRINHIPNYFFAAMFKRK